MSNSALQLVTEIMYLKEQRDADRPAEAGERSVATALKISPDRNRASPRAIPRPVMIVLAIGVLLRVGLWLSLGHSPQTHDDERDYSLLAVNLVERGEYAFTPGNSISLRPPLYPVFVAGIYQLFGVENWQAIGAVQALLSLGTVWIVYRLGTTAFSPQVGLWASALICFYPSLLGYNGLLLSEVVFTFLLCLSLLVLVRGLQKNSLAAFGGSGVVLGLAALTRSVLWLFPPLLGLYLIAVGPGGFARRLAAAILMCGAFTAIIAPWSVRNSRLQNTFVTIDVMGGRNLMMGNYAYTPLYRAWDAISVGGEQAWHSVLRSEGSLAAVSTQGQIDKIALHNGVNFMLEHPGLTLQRSLIKFINFWQLERELIAATKRGDFGAISPLALWLLALLITGSYVIAMFTGIFGAVLCPPGDWRIHGLFLLLIAFVCGLHTIVFGHSRYHLPLMPVVLLYSAAAITHVEGLWRQRKSGRFLLASALCLLLLASWGWELFGVDPQRYFSIFQ